MTFKEFNLIYHVHKIVPIENPDPELELDEDADIVDENKTYDRIVIPNLDELWLKLKPS